MLIDVTINDLMPTEKTDVIIVFICKDVKNLKYSLFYMAYNKMKTNFTLWNLYLFYVMLQWEANVP